MNLIITFALLILFALNLRAQTNETPARLAIITETAEVGGISDILTAELTKNSKIHLLERNEIEKVYREQGLSASNKDYLKVGQILGADGLMLININKTSKSTNLTTRLIAVKPGVSLSDESFPWPLKDLSGWATVSANHLNPLFPKLTVLVKDAIPISIVNLRSAAQSAEGQETERQLKLLTIQRLTQQPEFFVMERQRMQLLSEEKELKKDDSAFWNGSYLLEGVVDQNGYSQKIITINARLTPPKGGVPLLIEARGTRTNFSEVINQLSGKITELLKIQSSVKEWNANDEAEHYYEEAVWALKWGAILEAQSAADSAWILGKKDEKCASVRVRSYVSELPKDISVLANTSFVTDNPQAKIKEIVSMFPTGIVYTIDYQESHFTNAQGSVDGTYYTINYNYFPEPNPLNIDRAIHVLELYNQFSDMLPSDEPKVNSPWHNLGIETLEAVTHVLHHYQLAHEKRPPDSLADLRRAARQTAEWISKSPSVRDSYYASDRIITRDEIYQSIQENPNIYKTKVTLGCYWQETPEDCVSLYRELMNSPVFCYIHDDFWQTVSAKKHLIAWNDQDLKRIPVIWTNFIQELTDSTNVLLRMEAKAMELHAAANKSKAESVFTNLFSIIESNRESLVTNNVELFCSGWGLDRWANAELERGFYSKYKSEMDAMDSEYLEKTKTRFEFEKQKQYLKANTPYDFFEFVTVFPPRKYSKEHAIELLPLLASYKSNVITQAKALTGIKKNQAESGIGQISYLEEKLNRAQNPPIPLKVATPKQRTNPKAFVPKPLQITSNFGILIASNFMRIDTNQMHAVNPHEIILSASPARYGKLPIDVRYTESTIYHDDHVVLQGRETNHTSIALFDLQSFTWDFIQHSAQDADHRNSEYSAKDLPQRNYRGSFCLESFKNGIYLYDIGGLTRFDLSTRKWNQIKLPGQSMARFYFVNNQLFAANEEFIFQILDGEEGIRILASTRRRPPVSDLDVLENLKPATLFAGPGNTLRANVGGTIYSWQGENWKKGPTLPQNSITEVLDSMIIIRSKPYAQPPEFWLLSNDQTNAELFYRDNPAPSEYILPARLQSDLRPTWKTVPDLTMTTVDHKPRITLWHSNLIFYTETANGKWHADIVCLERGFPQPFVVPLRFDPERGPIPRQGARYGSQPVWMVFTPNFLLIGHETIPGIWKIPISDFESFIAAEKKRRSDIEAASINHHKAIAAKYDRNHNGVVDPEEREDALDDPAFIESELDAIDANHNGQLDLEELSYFDANNNKALDPKEQAGIDIAQHLFATKILKTFDANGDGKLDSPELDELVRSGIDINGQSISAVHQPLIQSHPSQLSFEELESRLKQSIIRSLRARRPRGTDFFNSAKPYANGAIDPKKSFKADVDYYFQHPNQPKGEIQNSKTP